MNFQMTIDILLFKYCDTSECDEFYLFDGLVVCFIENKTKTSETKQWIFGHFSEQKTNTVSMIFVKCF